jgi:cytochrome P450
MTPQVVKAPGGRPLLGHALELQRRPLQLLDQVAELGDLVEIRIGPRSVLIPTRPELLWQMLTDNRSFDKGGPVFTKARHVLGDGLATCTNDAHKRQRKLMQPAFHTARMSELAATMSQVIEQVIGRWRNGEEIDVIDQMITITARVAALTLAGTHLTTTEVEEFRSLYQIIMEGGYKRIVAPLGIAERLPTRYNRRYERARDRLRKIVEATVQRYQADGTDHGDLMSSMMEARDEDGNGMSLSELQDQVSILLTGEVEVVGATLSWAFHMLAEHPGYERALQEEADQVLGGRIATSEDLPLLPVAGRVVTEVLRMYPPGWLLTRQATRPTQLGGYPIKRGQILVFSPYLIHRHPDYFTNPSAFDPDRWLPGREMALPRGAYVPFGAGTRRCIGDNFGSTEATLALASISGRWRLTALPGAVVESYPRALLRPRSLVMRAEARTPSSVR